MNRPTKVTKQTFKGHPTISIWEVDPAGNPIGKYPIISLGVKKASALLQHMDALQEFVVDKDPSDDESR